MISKLFSLLNAIYYLIITRFLQFITSTVERKTAPEKLNGSDNPNRIILSFFLFVVLGKLELVLDSFFLVVTQRKLVRVRKASIIIARIAL